MTNKKELNTTQIKRPYPYKNTGLRKKVEKAHPQAEKAAAEHYNNKEQNIK